MTFVLITNGRCSLSKAKLVHAYPVNDVVMLATVGADHHDDGEAESWYGKYCHVGVHLNGNQCRCCNTCSQCGRHMCEECTVRCCTCGSIVCDRDALETPEGEWECVECECERNPEKKRLLDALEGYEETDTTRRVIRDFINSL